MLEGLGFAKGSFQQEVGKLSGGQQNRLLLARLLLAEPDLMLLDEPSNHLDIDATQWLEEYLIASDQAILVVSHDRYFLDRVTNRTLELYQGTVESYPGNFTQYKRLKAERLSILLVEQNYHLALAIADRVYVMSKGQIVWEGTPAGLEASEEVKRRYLGVS